MVFDFGVSSVERFLIAELSLLGANAHFQAHFKNQESKIKNHSHPTGRQ
jgi:hypothetical protein